jgi:hypothetical protein
MILQNKQSSIPTTLPSSAMEDRSDSLSPEPPGAGSLPQGAADALVMAFLRWSADQRVAEAARQRTRERSLRTAAVGSASFVGVLTDLAERRTDITATTSGHTWRGTLVGVGADFVVMEDHKGGAILLSTASVTGVTTGHSALRSSDPSGDRPAPLSVRLVDALAILATERNPVALSTGPGALIRGDLVAVGVDIVTIQADRSDPRRGGLTYLPVASLQACLPR